MVECLQELGFMVNVAPDPNEFCNRTITVYGKGGVVPPGGTEHQPMELFVGNAGTAARFLSAFVCLGKGVYRLHGVPRMHERPQAALFKALRELGYRVDSANDKLPVTIHGAGEKPEAKCTVSIEESSQFASALLLCAETVGWKIKVVGENAEESPYVSMTSELTKVFPNQGGNFQIEPDASSGSYFWATGWLFPLSKDSPAQQSGEISVYDFTLYVEGATTQPRFFSTIVKHWPSSDWQIDQWFPALLPEPPRFRGVTSRVTNMGDSIMTAIIVSQFASEPSKFIDLGRLRIQETERVVALRTELTKCGAKVIEDGDTLTVYPSKLHGAEIETYNDHRMAMCFAILGLKVPGIKIKNPACVKKTFPNFFQKLAAAPPHGLGAKILDGKTGRTLTHEELFAD
jgi:3-phosphoshikimate 1-carboxyvinyltransferase